MTLYWVLVFHFEDARFRTEAAFPEDPLQDRSLLLRRGLPVQEQLVIVGRQAVIKGLRDIHLSPSPGPAWTSMPATAIPSRQDRLP